MANNKIQVKRTSVSGRTANVTSSGNSQFIDAGEFALNMVDGILYTSNGSSLIAVGSNLVNQNISNTLTVKAISANGGNGSLGQLLTTNGTAVYWSTVASGAGGGYYYGDNGAVGIANNKVNIFRVNANTLNGNVTFNSGENGSATGPISIANGVTLTISAGARVSIV